MKRNLYPNFILCLCAAFLACCSPSKSKEVEAQKQSAVADDHSLTIESYLQMGMPSPDRMWTPEDYSQALKVLKIISQKDTRELPRYGSKNSGKLFNRISSRENLAAMLNENLPLDTRMSLMLGYIDGVKQILIVYFEPSVRGVVLDTESAELMGLMLKLLQKSLDLGNKFMASIPKDDPKFSVRQDGFAKMKDGLMTAFDGGIISMGETNFFRVSARLKLCGYLRETLPAVIRGFPATVQTEIPLRIKRMQSAEPNDQMKEALSELHGTIAAVLGH